MDKDFLTLDNNLTYKISETYIKFDLDYSESNKELIRQAFLRYVENNIEFKNSDFRKLRISIEFEKGSLKTKIITWGTVFYMGIANYGSFRAGLREIVNDVKGVSEVTVEQIKHDPNIDDNNIIRFEKRLGIPGRLNDLYRRVDSLQRNAPNYSQNELQQRLLDLKQDIADIAIILDFATRQEFIRELPVNISQNLPEPSPQSVNQLYNRYALKPNDENEYVK